MPRDSVMGWKASKPIIIVFGLVGGREFGGFTAFVAKLAQSNGIPLSHHKLNNLAKGKLEKQEPS